MPIRSKTIINFTNIIITSIWLLGMFGAGINYNYYEATELIIQPKNETIYVCHETFDENGAKVGVATVFAAIFLIPVTIMVYVYFSMAMVIFRRDLKNSACLMLKQQKRKVSKVVIYLW